ncbi:hypothetical protein ACK8HX_11450 [Oryzobacter sp. R7]|uniref:hypothetical protein n=1 Tax=Oryzobacter faecalis TaxID=3388656 RepID=UPI00398D1D5C
MVLLGLILVLLAAGAGVLLFAGTARLTDTVDIEILGGTLSLPPLTLLVTGMVVITVFWLGWALLRAGLRRGKRKRVEAKEAAAAAEARRVADEQRMKEQMAARDRELADERRRREEETAALRQQPPAPAPAEHRDIPADSRQDSPTIAPSGSTPPPPPPSGHRPSPPSGH